MLKGLGSLVVRALLLCLVSTPAWAGSTLYLDSQSGDKVGGGQQLTYTDSQGTFSVSGKINSGITLVYQQSSPAVTWTLQFAAPKNGSLADGNYDNAERYPAYGPLIPGINVYPSTYIDECTTINGRFVVRDIEVDGSGNVTAFAADFQQLCQGSTAPLLGAIRYNSSIPVSVDAPTADAGSYQIVSQGATVTLDGSLSLPGNGTITAYTWTQLSGPAVSLADASAVTTTFTAPTVSAGGADVVFQLEVDNSLALSNTATVTIHVANPADPVTALYISGDPNDRITQGNTYSFNAAQAQFTVKSTGGTQGLSIGVNGGIPGNFGIQLDAAAGQSLQVGIYDVYANEPSGLSSSPWLSIAGEGESCYEDSGRFVILDMQTDGSGNITSLAANFEQHCDGSPSMLRGVLRYNSTVPVDAPVADPQVPQDMIQGETVTLSAGTWITGTDGDDVTSYQWSQMSGPAVTLSDASAAAPTFTAPDVGAGGSDLTFQLTVTNSLGYSTTETVTVHVANPADAMTLIHLEFTPDTTERETLSYTATSAELSFTPTMTPSSMSMRIGGYASGSMALSMAAPASPQQPLQVGSYNNALEPLDLFPTLSFTDSGDARCYLETATGRFVILAIQTDGSGHLVSLAADFDEYCSDGSTLHGKLRYNSTVPLDTPAADAGGKQGSLQGSLVTLPATTSYAGSDAESIASYQWTQLSGPTVTLSDPTAAAPTFTAPSVAPGGADLVFQLTVTNANGLQGTDQITVHVYNPDDPRNQLHITSDAGDPVGKGQTFDYNELNALFGLVTPGYPYQGNGSAKLATVTYAQNQIPQPGQWSVEFIPILNQLLADGPYDQAQLANISGDMSGQPGLSVVSGYQGCNALTGRFDILDIQKDQNGNITSLAVDFEQTCSGASGGLHGQLRYNSAVPLNVPYADAGTPQVTDRGSVITLGGSGSDAGPDGATIAGYQWTQLSGPTVTLSDPSGANPTFTSPDVPLGGADLVFQLTVTNSNGMSTTSTVTVHVGNPDDPKTRFFAVSDPNDPIGEGETYDFRTTNAVFSVSTAASNGVANNSVTITANNGTFSYDAWQLTVTAPPGQALKAGTRYVLNPALGLSAPQPILSATPGFRFCDYEGGFFVVRDLQTDSSGNITSFAADFVQRCDSTNSPMPALVGWVRYNSTVPMSTPLADTGSNQETYSGFPVTLDGSNSRSAPGVTLSYAWSQVAASGDPAVTLSDPTAAKPAFLAPDVPLGGRTLHFALTVTGSNGLTDTSTVAVTDGNEADRKSVFYFESDLGDPLGGGASGLIINGDNEYGSISSTPYSTANDATMSVYSAILTNSGWTFEFYPGYPNALTAGKVYTSVAGTLANMSVSSYGITCDSPDTTFIVRDISTNSTGRLQSLGVDFIVHCSGATGSMRGALRYNSKTPILINEPTAAPGPNRTITQAGAVTLDGSTSFPGWGNIVSYRWQQVGGPKIALSGGNTAQAGFTVTQRMLEGTGTNFAFELTVKNSLGLTSSSEVAIRAALPTANLISLSSDSGDPVDKGRYVYVEPSDSAITAGTLGRTGASVTLLGGSGWTFDFAAPVGQKLRVGTYSNAVLYSGVAGNKPELYAAPAKALCKTVTGSFTVRDVVYGRNGVPDVLAVDFAQHCNGIGPALQGEIRYHSTLP